MIDIVVTEVQTKLSSVLIFATATHCCQRAENSALLLKSSGKKMFLRRKLIAELAELAELAEVCPTMGMR